MELQFRTGIYSLTKMKEKTMQKDFLLYFFTDILLIIVFTFYTYTSPIFRYNYLY